MMMATFKCKQSGNTVSFIDENDIASMRKETHYEEIGNEISAITTPAQDSDNAPQNVEWEAGEDANRFYDETKENAVVLIDKLNIKKRGRPAKIQFEV